MPLLKGAEAKYGIILKTFFCLSSPILRKNAINLNFHYELYYSSTF